MPQLKLSVPTPGFFSYNVWVWMKKFCFCLLAVTRDHIPVIEVMYFLPTSHKDDKQYCYVSLECVLLPATSLTSEDRHLSLSFGLWVVLVFCLFVCILFGFFGLLVWFFFLVFIF